MAQLFTNNASALLPSSVASDDVTITLDAGEGDRFPQPTEGDENSFAILTLEDQNANIEVVKMTARDGDLLTITRGQEGTVPAGFAAGDRIELRMTAGSLQQFKQLTDQWSLRGGTINSDGQRFWHVTDASSYQYFLQSYVTLNPFGLHLMRWQPPPGIDKLGYSFGVNGPEGELRNFQFAAGLTSNAPPPAQGEAAVEIPGVLRMSSLNNPFGSPVMYATWDTFFAEEQGGIRVSRLKFEPDPVGDSTVNYFFTTRTPQGVLRRVIFDGEGSIVCEREIGMRNREIDSHPTSDNLIYTYFPRPDNPEAGDLGYWFPSSGENVQRTTEYRFRVRDVIGAGGDSPEVVLRDFNFMRDGNLRISGTPTSPNDVVSLGFLKEAVYGRTVLWAGGADSTDTDKTLDASLEGFHQVIVTGRVATFFTFSVVLDVDQIKLGYGVAGTVYLLGMATSTVYAGIRFVTATTFNVVDTNESAVVEQVLGIIPR